MSAAGIDLLLTPETLGDLRWLEQRFCGATRALPQIKPRVGDTSWGHLGLLAARPHGGSRVGLAAGGLVVRCQFPLELLELESARFDDQTHGCRASRNKIELRERAFAAAAELRPERILCVAEDADDDVVDRRLLASGRVRVSFGELERALQEHGLRQRSQDSPTAAPPAPTCHTASRFVDRGATERAIQSSDHLLDVDPEAAQQFAAAVAERDGALRLQSSELGVDSLRGKAARTQDAHGRGVARA